MKVLLIFALGSEMCLAEEFSAAGIRLRTLMSQMKSQRLLRLLDFL
jgi:hypothetical protein